MFNEKDVILGRADGSIEHRPHNGKGLPWAVLQRGRPLNNRQQALLDRLPGYDSRVTVRKSDVSMSDLAALTAKTGVEYAMFTRGPERLVVRGDRYRVNVCSAEAALMRIRGYKWSGHTHVVGLVDSPGDKAVLDAFGQGRSVIYNANGEFREFYWRFGG